MNQHIEVNSVREGIYLLWRLDYTEEVQQFIFNTANDTQQINKRINEIIRKSLSKNGGDATIIQSSARYLNIFRRRQIDETQLVWLKREHLASLYFWLWLIKNHIMVYNDTSGSSRHYSLRDRKIQFTLEEIFNLIPNSIEQTYQAALFLLDILPNSSLLRKSNIVSTIRQDYLDYQLKLNANFVWLVDADDDNIQWVMTQFIQHRRILSDIRKLNFSPEIQRFALPILYSLWDAHPDTKRLFLTALRKRYANMKHRKKVADKSPVNIRISENSKKKLVKLEKYFNRNRADVIEYLIEKAWAERGNKN
ncbi:hypothetical protein LL668_18285 [Providencia rettgeri]|uniref:hypothetical protein n=1 Tax=Providencia rettgeri TaxID=587 RepID=UPI001E445705|nr:hypothetical protein [Providencia rettgeri]UEK59211.1 hypothetical protein LL668_18285 [Providencia rettgeri]